jgi:branched-chain amino acid transport system substrate-binding protein
LQRTVKIGFVTTLTTGGAVIGNDMKNAVDLAMEHLGGQAGGPRSRSSSATTSSRRKPASRSPTSWSSRTMSISSPATSGRTCCWPRRNSVVDEDTFLISANAGPSQMAGVLCHENFFSTSWQNDQTPMAMGRCSTIWA